MIISFEDYCEDILDLQIALMSVSDLRECKAAYTSYIKPAKKVAKENHPDSHLKLADLKTKAERLISNQAYAVNKYSGNFDVSLSINVVAKDNSVSYSYYNRYGNPTTKRKKVMNIYNELYNGYQITLEMTKTKAWGEWAPSQDITAEDFEKIHGLIGDKTDLNNDEVQDILKDVFSNDIKSVRYKKVSELMTGRIRAYPRPRSIFHEGPDSYPNLGCSIQAHYRKWGKANNQIN